MYEKHFGLKEKPFSIAPDPRFLFLSERHREALAHLVYGLEDNGGFVLVTGEVGTGKTTLLRCLLDLVPQQTDVAFVLNPRVNALELLKTMCDELRIVYRPREHSIKAMIDVVNQHLLASNAAGRQTVLIIDEAQNLSPGVLEQIRLLTNLETNERKLLRIILLGQPELRDMLAEQELRQLAQRITARYHLGPLTASDTQAYVAHRLGVAGGNIGLITRGAVSRLHKAAGGIPRLINVIADRAMLGAYSQGAQSVTTAHVRHATVEVRGPASKSVLRKRVALATAAAIAVTALGATALWRNDYLPSGGGGEQAVRSTLPSPAPRPTSRGVAPQRSQQQLPTTRYPAPGDAAAGSAIDVPEQDIDQTQRASFQTLFGLWRGPQAPGRTEPCRHALTIGLRCLPRSGGWASLEVYNRPAVLELVDGDGRPYWIAVTRLRADAVTVVVNGREHQSSRRLIDARWGGRFTLLWQMPPSYKRAISLGQRSEAVHWLQALLENRDPAELEANALDPSLSTAAEFDEALQGALTRFQRAAGIQADGIAGPQTWVLLNERAGGVPILTPRALPTTVPTDSDEAGEIRIGPPTQEQDIIIGPNTNLQTSEAG